MKRLLSLQWWLVLSFILHAQEFQFLGLANKNITSLKIGTGIIAVGTNHNGVYWQQFYNVSDTGWNKIDLNSVHVTAVYPHKSGPVGWAIGICAEPSVDNSEFIFCSFMGGIPKPMSYGIDTNNTTLISGIDGFEDPSICGETFAIGNRKLYRRFFQDTVWHSVYDLTIAGNFASLKAREDNQYVYAGGSGEGYSGVLLIRSSDKGNTWEHLYPSSYLYHLDFFGQTNHEIIVTDGSKVILSTDSGLIWSQIFQTDSLIIQKISFSPDGQRIFIITNMRFYDLPRTYFFYSSDVGETWNVLQLPIYDIVADMDIDTDDNIYLASISSGVFRLKSPVVDVKEESENIFSENFILSQNYPNPFNPSTKISWQSPVNSWQTLKVYDVLGNEVATLVNEYKPAGNYEVEFNTVGTRHGMFLPSGVYFYQLKATPDGGQAGDYVQTKKMVLMR